MKSDLHDVTVQKLATTEKAVKLTDDGRRSAWFPLSQIEIEANKDGKTYTLTCPEWLLSEKEWL